MILTLWAASRGILPNGLWPREWKIITNSMKFKLNNQNKDYEIEIIEQNQGVKVIVNDKEFLFGDEEQQEVPAVTQAIMPRRDLSSKEVRAVLAGSVSELFVNVGDVVRPGQKLLILSAMKMENEILAECEGKIKEIKIVKNQKVKEGEVLITLI